MSLWAAEGGPTALPPRHRAAWTPSSAATRNRYVILPRPFRVEALVEQGEPVVRLATQHRHEFGSKPFSTDWTRLLEIN